MYALRQCFPGKMFGSAVSLLEVTEKGFCWMEVRTVLIVFGIVSSVGLWWDMYLMGVLFCVGFRLCFGWLVGFLSFCFGFVFFLIKNNVENLPVQRTK